ncbi:hypothetical protein [Nocardioides nitrophenolicus]|uniref:hypothetical protein n=1 Tax=Nocardioides nitrophenolicus TaxID=60489 RepID=UPI0019581354|nr:hypothetical protein [Nocardioides nitrophenolicus]MBM7518271.1 hypothetical protein [Nocardioides nitrophenolicus]
MSKSLSDLLADSAPAPLPKASLTVTLIEGQHILDEIAELDERLQDAVAASRRTNASGERTGPPRKAGETAPDIAAIGKQSEDALARLAAFQVKIGLTGTSSGEWHRWKDEHPPRKESAGDINVTHGWCNSVDLFDDLGKYVSHWDGAEVPEGAWDAKLAEKVTYADRRALTTKVVEMFEQGVNRVPFSSSGSSTTEDSATA